MSGLSRAEEIEALIAEFQRLELRELHLRCGDLEIYLSSDPHQAALHRPTGTPLASAGRPPAASGTAAPASTPASPASSPAAGSGPRDRASAPAEASPPAAPAAQSAAAADPADLPPGALIVRAPYLGTFYRAPKPGAAPFVQVGSSVTAGADLCLVEVMKLFTTLRAEAPGKVHAILATDGSLVAAEQPLFVLVPA